MEKNVDENKVKETKENGKEEITSSVLEKHPKDERQEEEYRREEKESTSKETKEEVEPTQTERLDELSQKIFGKPSKDIKYVYVTNYIHQQLLEEELARTGLYQWVNVFKGEVKYPRDIEDYNDYDIVHVNMSTQDIHLAANVRREIKEDSNTRLIVNNDYTTEMWGSAFGHPDTMSREIMNADMIFGTEYFQVTALAELVDRKVFIIPHPADVKRLKSLPELPKKSIISTIWRRYDNNSYIPSLVTRNLGFTTQLIGYEKSVDSKTWLTTTLFDYVFAGTNYFDFCDQLRESEVVYDPFTFHSYNRAIVDCAALGVPVVGSNRTQSINVCYPFTKVDPYDVTAARRMIEKLATDDVFKKKVIDYAREKVEYYNHPNSMEKYLMALDESIDEAKEEKKVREIIKPTVKDKGRGNDVNMQLAQEKTVKNVKEKKFWKNKRNN